MNKLRKLIREMIIEEAKKLRYAEPSLYRGEAHLQEDDPFGKPEEGGGTGYEKAKSGPPYGEAESDGAPYGKPKEDKYFSTTRESIDITEEIAVIQEGAMDKQMIQVRNKIGSIIKFVLPGTTNKIVIGKILGTASNKTEDFVIVKYNNKKIYVPLTHIGNIDEMSSVNSMEGGDSFQTPFAFSKPGADPKKKRALKNNKWTVVESFSSDWETFLLTIDSTSEADIEDLFDSVGEKYIDTPGDFHQQGRGSGRGNIAAYTKRNMGASEYNKLYKFYKNHRKECNEFVKKFKSNINR